MKVQTNSLTGAALDWAVAKCEGRGNTFGHGFGAKFAYYPSSRWSQGGPIIEREQIGVCHYNEEDGWEVPNWAAWRTDTDDRQMTAGPTPLIAAMRCFVASRLGEEVDVPEELL